MTTLNGVVLNADRRGHENFSNVYWKRAPPVLANTNASWNTTTSDFFIKVKTGFHFVITDMHNKSACLPGTSISESPRSTYNLVVPIEGGYPTPPPPSPPLAPYADRPCTEANEEDRCKVNLKIQARLLPC